MNCVSSHSERVYSRVSAPDLYCGGARFGSWPRHQLSRFLGFYEFLQVDHDRFLPHPFKFILYDAT
jgi:hypothetical protein